MKDKSLGIWLISLFGISGIAVVMLAWLLPTLESDRTIATLTGSVGLLLAAIHVISLRRQSVGNNDEKAPVKVNIEDNI